ncbi:hypothetical protein NDU88_006423 [Pleurodeles waltl]|uniref:Uncharacterized protein n=1 Tax=Pleurodeles waltl TaxID=8319 RepID=A0AAV7TDF7_PLEWA|nr:hypothetical protein NDU88_006423 [Pleurodeles waltl]
MTAAVILTFPLGRRATAKRPPGKAPATMKPAPNGAGGVAGVRRVQWQCFADTENLNGALSGAPRHPFPPASSWRCKPPGTGWREGGRNPHGGAACSAAMEDSLGQGKTVRKPPVSLF